MILRLMLLMVSFFEAPLLHAKDWEQRGSSNFIVYYRSPQVPEDFVQTVVDQAEDDLKRVSDNIGITRYQRWGWDKRASIFIYRDQEDYVKNGGQAQWSHGAALLAFKAISTYPSASGFFDTILPHELGHIVLHEYLGPTVYVPLWFDEGVAMYQEKAKQWGAHQVVKKALENGEFIPLTQLMDMRLYKNSKPESVRLFYAEAASAVNFMVTQLGESNFYRFCNELKNRTRFEDALAKIYIRLSNAKDLNKAWVRFLEDQ